MTYSEISNEPLQRERHTYSHVWWDGAFTEEELKEIDKIFSSFQLENGSTFGVDDLETTKRIRKSKIHFVYKDETTKWIFDRFNFVIKSLNDQYYNFDLNGYESIQYTVYDAENEGKYDWHMDMLLGIDDKYFSNHSTRKLSIVMCLSEQGRDFVGGEFELNVCTENKSTYIPLHKGKIIAFPSWMIHRVKPVIRGIRKSLVIWVEGPKFK